jgi:hypothetical protein
MPLFSRRRRAPESVKQLRLESGERRVAWALSRDGMPVVATGAGLYLPGAARLDWEQVERALWREPVLTVLELAEVEASGTAHVVELDLSDGTDMPEVVRARVSASVAWSSHVRLAPAGGVRIVGRRRPGLEVFDWQLVFDRDTDPHDPQLRAQAEQHLEAARRTIG